MATNLIQSARRRPVVLGAGVAVAVVGLAVLGSLLLRGLWRATLAAGKEPPPALVRVVAAFPGASAEEVERHVTVPLEVTLAGMPGLEHACSRSFPELSEIRLRFADGTAYQRARQEVINRLQFAGNLPPGVSPQLTPFGPDVELLRYTLAGPRDARGQPLYSPGDLRAVQDWSLERALRRIPGVLDVCGHGGTVKRYEVRPDPTRLTRYGVSLRQALDTLAGGNANVGGENVRQGKVNVLVRGLGVLGGGRDPMEKAANMKTAAEAAAYLGQQEKRRLRELRATVLRTVNGLPVRVDDVVEGGPILTGRAELEADLGRQGVIVGQLARTSVVVRSRPPGPGEAAWHEDEVVGGVVYLVHEADRRRALDDVRAGLKELTDGPADLLPGLRVDVYDEHTEAPDAGPLWLLADLPADLSVDEAAGRVAQARARLEKKFTQIRGLVTEIDWPDVGGPVGAFYQARLCVLLRPEDEPRPRAEVAAEMAAEMSRGPAALAWRSADVSRADGLDAFVPGPEEGLVKLIGPDLEALARVGRQVEARLKSLPAVAGVRVLVGKGQPALDLRVDRDKCARWGVTVAEVNFVLDTALRGGVATQMVEGEKLFDVALRWPERFRRTEADLLKLPLAIAPAGPDAVPQPAAARVTLGQLVTPEAGAPGRVSPAVIHREDGKRLLPIRFRVRPGRQRAEVAAEARAAIQGLLPPGYRAEWAP